MIDLFTSRRDLASCPLTKQNHLVKCSNVILRTSPLVNDGTLRSITYFASSPSNVKNVNNVKNVKISDLLAFLVLKLFSFFVLTWKSFAAEAYTSRKFQNYENIHREDRLLFDNWKTFLAEVSFHFHLQLCKNTFECLVSCVRKKEIVRNQCQNKWNKDFITETVFLRSLFIIINKKLQYWAKYLKQNREIQKNWTGQVKFDIYFCVFFDCYCQNLISGRDTWH